MSFRLPHLPLLLLAALAGSACSDSSPTRPQPAPEPSVVVFADPNALAAHRDTIVSLLEETVERAEASLSLSGVQILVSADAGRAIQGWGIGGFAPSATEIEIAIDPDYPGLAEILPERLPPIAAHELHHAARWRGPGYGSTLLESMVSEGMADHFAVELLGSPIPPWSEAFPEEDTDLYLARARPELDSVTFDFGEWFFGPSFDLPRWTGYTLGFRLVRDYLESNPGSSAAGLVNASAELFRPEA